MTVAFIWCIIFYFLYVLPLWSRVEDQLFEEGSDQDAGIYFEEDYQQPYEEGKWGFPIYISILETRITIKPP